MSELENKVERDQNGFFNCQLLCISTSQQCSRRYLTLVGFENHVKLEHNDLKLSQIKEKQVEHFLSIDVVHAKIHPQFPEDQEPFLKSNIIRISPQEISNQLKEYKISCVSLYK